MHVDGDEQNLKHFRFFVYRSAQPTAAGFLRLEKLGIKTVVNLRAFHGDKQRLRGTGSPIAQGF